METMTMGAIACVDVVTSSVSPMEGVLANDGAPFYSIAIMVVILGGLGFAVHGTKKMAPGVLLLPESTHLLQFMLTSAGMMSEMVLATAVMISGDRPLLVYGVILLLSRVMVGVVPGVTVFKSIFSGKDEDHVDASSGEKALKYFIDSDVILDNSKLYVAMLSLAIFEPTLLMFLPWYETEMSRVANFPTLEFTKKVYIFEMLQLVVTLAAQLGIIFKTQGDGGTFGIIVIMNVCFSAVMLCMKGFDMFLKWGLLRGAAKDEDCKAARKAWKKIQKERRSATGAGTEVSLELGALYGGGDETAEEGDSAAATTNPMLANATATAAAFSVLGSGLGVREEEEGLLSPGGLHWERRMESVVNEIHYLESRQTSLETTVHDMLVCRSGAAPAAGGSGRSAPHAPGGGSEAEDASEEYYDYVEDDDDNDGNGNDGNDNDDDDAASPAPAAARKPTTRRAGGWFKGK
jgi:hypothetical protein